MRRMPLARAVLFASSCVVAFASCGVSARDREDPLPELPARPAAAIAPLAPMVGGAWWTTFPDGRRQAERWHLGPGGNSLRVDSYGDAGGERTCGVVRVYYWHLGEQRLRLRAFLRGRRVVEGSVHRDTEGHLAETVLAAPGALDRPLVWHWSQLAADEASLRLGEGNALHLVPMTDWRFHRSSNHEVHDPSIVSGSASLSPALRAFEPMVGPKWQARLANKAVRTTSFHAIPFAELVHARTTAGAGEVGAPEADLYVYVAPRGAPLQALLLLADGTVGEGAVGVLPGGAVRFDPVCHGPSGMGSFQVDLEVRNGSLCQQVRSVAGGPKGIGERSWDFLTSSMAATGG